MSLAESVPVRNLFRRRVKPNRGRKDDVSWALETLNYQSVASLFAAAFPVRRRGARTDLRNLVRAYERSGTIPPEVTNHVKKMRAGHAIILQRKRRETYPPFTKLELLMAHVMTCPLPFQLRVEPDGRPAAFTSTVTARGNAKDAALIAFEHAKGFGGIGVQVMPITSH